jgi:hypothetical protein
MTVSTSSSAFAKQFFFGYASSGLGGSSCKAGPQLLALDKFWHSNRSLSLFPSNLPCHFSNYSAPSSLMAEDIMGNRYGRSVTALDIQSGTAANCIAMRRQRRERGDRLCRLTVLLTLVTSTAILIVAVAQPWEAEYLY